MEKKAGRPCKKSYDPMAVMEELLATVDAVFEEKQQLQGFVMKIPCGMRYFFFKGILFIQ